MKKEQQNYYRMFLNVQNYMDDNTAKWSAVGRIATYKNDIDELISRISDKTTEAESKVSVTERKEMLRKAIAIKAASVSGILQAYFNDQGNPDMANSISLTKSDVMNLKEADIASNLSKVLTAARENLENLTDFGMTEVRITELETTIQDFNPLIGKPRGLLNQKYVALDTIAQLFDEANKLLRNNLDKIMLMFGETDAEFYNGYLRARTIVDM